MLYYDRGLFLHQPRIGIDVQHPVAAGFISHAHFDHMAAHRMVFCTPATGRFFNHRLRIGDTRTLPFYETVEMGGVQMTTYPAGHILGSAMLCMARSNQRVLYTGDFQLNASPTAESANPPKADTLIMECTFGRPEFVMPARETVVMQLVDRVKKILATGNSPVIHAYTLGKAQAITKILSDHDFLVLQHPKIFQITQLYEELGCPIGNYSEYLGELRPGSVLMLPPRHHRAPSVGNIPRAVRIGLTGWALAKGCHQKMRVDFVFAYSDHADYQQLWELIDRVEPKKIFCTHGSKAFVLELRERGFDAEWLDRKNAYCLKL